eukprot:scaffold3115_cov109-Skeletonema_dohrnii-CCMP3373.AAC.3
MVSTNPRLAYLHNLCEESSSSDMFRGALFAELPDDVFNESTDRPSGRGRGGGGGKASGRGRGGRGGGKGGAKGGENAALNSIASKNEAQKLKLRVETKGILRNQMDDTDKQVADLKKKFVEHCGDKEEAKRRLKASKLKRNQTRDNSDDSSDSSDDEDPDESQQSLCNRIHDLKDRKKELKGDLNALIDPTPKRRKK